mgnify:CR=1 FL=1
MFRTREIDRMEDALASMESGLNSFTKYVPRDVVRVLQRDKSEARMGVVTTPLTVFFSDVAGFTTITEMMQPEDLVDLISQYLHEMSKVILDSGGLVDKYIGDAVMAFWNAPLPIKNHAIVGCQAALRSQQRLRELQDGWAARGYPPLMSRIGLNSGNAHVGNIGSPDRMAFTAIGEEVSLAATLEELNKVCKQKGMLFVKVGCGCLCMYCTCVYMCIVVRMCVSMRVLNVDVSTVYIEYCFVYRVLSIIV